MEEKLQEALNRVKKNISMNRYPKLKKEFSALVRSFYKRELNIPLEGKEINIFTLEGTLVAKGYERVVVGDYGAYLEIPTEFMVRENIKIKKGEEYRIKDPKFNQKVKYFWLTSKDKSDIKIYFQQKEVKYADYKSGFCYISPKEIKI